MQIEFFVTVLIKEIKKQSLAQGLLNTNCNDYYNCYILVTELQSRNITLVG